MHYSVRPILGLHVIEYLPACAHVRAPAHANDVKAGLVRASSEGLPTPACTDDQPSQENHSNSPLALH
eukprot:13348677-Alexandrium_andersonii.AAC.1